MKITKKTLCYSLLLPLLTFQSLSLSAISPALAYDHQYDTVFLQKIQDKLAKTAGLKDRTIRLEIIHDQKQVFDVTSSSVIISHGFIQKMENMEQMVSALAHMTAHISLNAVPPAPQPEHDKMRAADAAKEPFLKGAVSQRYPDKSQIPEATGGYVDNEKVNIERPEFRNEDYEFQINRGNIVKAEQELEVDQAAQKILHHAGFCPQSYRQMLHYFYEQPEKLAGNKHFALGPDQWQRVDMIDQSRLSGRDCSAQQNDLGKKYQDDFARLKSLTAPE